MLRPILILAIGFSVATAMLSAQPDVRVEPAHLQGPRILADQTATAVVKNYIESWDSLRAALEQNRPELLDRDFVGGAKDKLTDTIQQQARLGMKASYKDRSHDIQIVFYSPEGLSVELVDNVEYDLQVFDKDKGIATQPVRARYIVVLTPTEVRWRVRVLQATNE
ncbi:MAG TPA: hypothetical protein VG225_14100 [Terracidiphilus sp.]|jgi:hypothetical protein|nr:hypothetical protein [Terracidiphilus sp.]